MIYVTKSGSEYEVNESERKARQLKCGGQRERPSEHFTMGEWREYTELSKHEVLAVDWPDGQVTVTSRIVATR